MQRLCLTFSRSEELKYISHLDLMRLWERVLRRADIPVAYSQGFSPHPRLSLAAPLAIGVTSECELMEVFLERRVSSYFFIKAASGQLPPGLEISAIEEVGLRVPSLQSRVRYAEYRVELETEKGPEDVQSDIRALLSREHLPWQHTRDKEIRRYDLRALVDKLWLSGWQPPQFILGMMLRCDSRGSGRPEQVTMALGFSQQPKSIHRTRLILAPGYGG